MSQSNEKGEHHMNSKLDHLKGPAVQYPWGKKEWWVNGKRHREDGPVVEYQNGKKEWWVNGRLITSRSICQIL